MSTIGTWVSDDDAQPEALPGSETISNPTMQMEGPMDGLVDEGCLCEDEAGFDGGAGPAPGCWWNDLWTEVHAHRRTFVQVDYLSFWAKGNPVPPLVTTSPLGTPQAQAGVLPDSATTATLFGNTRLDVNQRSGARINFGYWLVDGEFAGIEAQYFALQQQNTTFHAASSPSLPILARPFFNVDPNLVTPAEDSALVAYPNFAIGPSIVNLTGSIDIRSTSDIQSANALYRQLIWIDFTSQRRLDILLGYRFFRLNDSVTINDMSTLSGGLFPTTVLTSQDQFSARNEFNGGEIGVKYQSYHGPVSLEVVAKSAFGNNSELVYINGFNATTAAGVTTTGVGGLLAQPTNIGTYRRDVFTILPEGDFNLRFDVARNLRLTLGYTFIYANRVQRSGDAINRTLNPTQIGGALNGPAQPSFAFHDSTFWVQGATAGFEYRW
ncbi:MAG TPA: BBP7 family outer membrane beta-barrel protein [Pirellulales bacterium]|nr:BBP7 family outer membrane beta-barrel protein [Pirellulales bacterium]